MRTVQRLGKSEKGQFLSVLLGALMARTGSAIRPADQSFGRHYQGAHARHYQIPVGS
jgi:hypothetical protein